MELATVENKKFVLLDCSGSMNRGTGDQAVTALRANGVEELYVFSDNIAKHSMRYPLEFNGQTALYESICWLGTSLEKQEQQGVDLLVVTDGLNNCKLKSSSGEEEFPGERIGSFAECFAWLKERCPRVHVTLALAVIGTETGQGYADELCGLSHLTNFKLKMLAIGDATSTTHIIDSACSVQTGDKVQVWSKGKPAALSGNIAKLADPVAFFVEFGRRRFESRKIGEISQVPELTQLLVCFMLTEMGANGGYVVDWAKMSPVSPEELPGLEGYGAFGPASNCLLSKMLADQMAKQAVEMHKVDNNRTVYNIKAPFVDKLRTWVADLVPITWDSVRAWANNTKKRKRAAAGMQ